MELVPKNLGAKMGKGSERSVYKHPETPDDKVVTQEGIIRPEKIKEAFYIQRILATLYPQNFPRFPAVAVSETGEGSAVRERLKERIMTQLARSWNGLKTRGDLVKLDAGEFYGRDEVAKTFSSISQELEQLGFKLQFDYTNQNNFMKSSDTGVWNYVDVTTIERLPTRGEFLERVHTYRGEVDQNDATTCSKALESLHRLHSETAHEFINNMPLVDLHARSFTFKNQLFRIEENTPPRLLHSLKNLAEVVKESDVSWTHKRLFEKYSSLVDAMDRLHQLYIKAKVVPDKVTEDPQIKSGREFEVLSLYTSIENLLNYLQKQKENLTNQ